MVNQPVHRAGALLDHLARRVRVRSEAVLAPLGLRPRHLVALTVLRNRGNCTQQSLATTLEMDGTNCVAPASVSSTTCRRRSPEDRRRHVVELTDAGATQLAKAESALAAVEDEVLGALDETQRETLHTLLLQAARGGETSCPTDIDA